MSWENERRTRIVKLLEILRANRDENGKTTWVQSQLIYREMPEITKNRFFLYLDELEWAGLLVHNRKEGKVKIK